MASMAERRQALAGLIQQTLAAIDEGYTPERVEVYLREAILSGRYPGDQKRIMGDPVRYCVVFDAGFRASESDADATIREVPLRTHDAFFVQLWHGYHDGGHYEAASQAVFDRLRSGEGSLLETLRVTPWLSDIDEPLGVPLAGSVDLVALDGKGQLRAHYLAFTIEVG